MRERGVEYIEGPTKRRLDLFGGIAIAASLMPIGAIVGAEAILEYKRLNPIFKQVRIGRQEVPITIYKFESLHDKSAQLQGGYNHPGASEMGKFVRHTGLDEIPQIVNVLKGDISLVGIRPVPQDFLDYFASEIPSYLFDEWLDCYKRNQGLTGKGQLFMKQFSNPTTRELEQQMKIEIGAFNSASLENDLRVIALTPIKLLRDAKTLPKFQK